MDACDELGLVVMNCLMGWQYFGKDPAFAEMKYQETRQLIRRDRNHPSRYSLGGFVERKRHAQTVHREDARHRARGIPRRSNVHLRLDEGL
jgi:hypothetical protein